MAHGVESVKKITFRIFRFWDLEIVVRTVMKRNRLNTVRAGRGEWYIVTDISQGLAAYVFSVIQEA